MVIPFFRFDLSLDVMGAVGGKELEAFEEGWAPLTGGIVDGLFSLVFYDAAVDGSLSSFFFLALFGPDALGGWDILAALPGSETWSPLVVLLLCTRWPLDLLQSAKKFYFALPFSLYAVTRAMLY